MAKIKFVSSMLCRILISTPCIDKRRSDICDSKLYSKIRLDEVKNIDVHNTINAEENETGKATA